MLISMILVSILDIKEAAQPRDAAMMPDAISQGPHRGRDAFRCSLPRNVSRNQAGNEALFEIPGNTLRLRIGRETGSAHEEGAKAGSAPPDRQASADPPAVRFGKSTAPPPASQPSIAIFATLAH